MFGNRSEERRFETETQATASAISLASVIGATLGEIPTAHSSEWPGIVVFGRGTVRLLQKETRLIVHIDTEDFVPDAEYTRKILTLIGFCTLNGYEWYTGSWPDWDEFWELIDGADEVHN